MKLRARALLRGFTIAAAAIAYAVLAHVSNSTPGASALGVVLATGPLLLVPVMLAWRSRYRLGALLLVVLAGALVYEYWRVFAQYFPWLYLLQQAGAYGLLGLAFGRSLAPARVPLCTEWATTLHGPLRPAVARYTRAVTQAWTLFFALVTIALLALFVFAPLSVWSAFANFCTFPLVVTMFVGEYIVRRRVLPDAQQAGILDGARAFLDSRRDPAVARRG